MTLPNFRSPVPFHVLLTFIMFSALTPCGLAKKAFALQHKGFTQDDYSESPFVDAKSMEFADQVLLTNIDSYRYIPNAPVLLFLPPVPQKNIHKGKFLFSPKTFDLPKNEKPTTTFESLKPKTKLFQNIWDDLDLGSLIQVIENQLILLNRLPAKEKLIIGDRIISRHKLKETLEFFLLLLKKDLSEPEFHKRVLDEFEFISAGSGSNRKMLFTGYYTPIIEASRTRTLKYKYPIYEKPENLSRTRYIYRQHLKNEPYSRLYLINGPNYTREDIDGHRLLDNRNLEIAWLKDDMDRYFLHIQGSGLLRFPDGTLEGVQYTGSNGYGYKSVGKRLLEEGVIPISKGSMQSIKQHFRENPDDIPKYVYQNKRYIFFKKSDGNPMGASGSPVVEGRSIAVDTNYYPFGSLGLALAKKPVLNDDDEVKEWKKFARFVVTQDRGAAIKGPGHVDLYFGKGKRAGAAAGRFMQQGKLFFLLKK